MYLPEDDSLYERALLSPSEVFDDPMHVVVNVELSREQKREILRRWTLDVRQLMVAEEENMGGGEAPAALERVQAAYKALGGDDSEPKTPTKIG